MPLLARTVLAPLTVDVRHGALKNLGNILVGHRIISGSGLVAVVVGPGMGAALAPVIAANLPGADILRVQTGTVDLAVALGHALKSRAYEAVIGVGGGRLIDTVKYAAAQHGIPMVTVATSLAHDGIASPVAVLERDGVNVSYGVQIPLATVVDLDLVGQAPRRQVRSGIGDALSNLSAVADWTLAHEVTGERIDGLAVVLARAGAEALLSHPGGIADDDFLTTLTHALLLGGMAMTIAGSSRPCSGGCHEISHALSRLHPGVGTHGEQVGLGALFCTWLRGAHELFARLAAALARHGLPRVPSDLGLSSEQFADAVELAPDTRPGRYTILEHLALDSRKIRARVGEYIDVVAQHDAETTTTRAHVGVAEGSRTA